MKIRCGFVTNSSSSCYLINLPKKLRLYELFGIVSELPIYKEDMTRYCDYKLLMATDMRNGDKTIRINICWYSEDTRERFLKFLNMFPYILRSRSQ